MSERVVALLPMKAHSERVRGKNFRSFAGRPLFRWILDSLLQVSDIDLVIINTDARDILADHGLIDGNRVMIRDRRPEICGDLVSMNTILADDVASVPASIYCMTHTTNPLLKSATISGALEKYRRELAANTADSLFTVQRTQTRFYRADTSPVNHDPGNLIRTQDLEPWFEENSNLYIFSQQSFASTNARIGNRPAMFEMSRTEGLDIDDADTWKLAEAMALYGQTNPGMAAE